MDCDFCYAQPVYVVVFSKGREILLCNNTFCWCRLREIYEQDKDEKIHSITPVE